ncbi:hypothetical protein ACLB2K_052760 [Fragaria x ananassa]
MGLKEEFEEHAEKAKTLPESTTNENKLILYGLYKQATVGNVNTARPGMFNMRDRAKWDAWKAVEGKSTDEAMGGLLSSSESAADDGTCLDLFSTSSFLPSAAASLTSGSLSLLTASPFFLLTPDLILLLTVVLRKESSIKSKKGLVNSVVSNFVTLLDSDLDNILLSHLVANIENSELLAFYIILVSSSLIWVPVSCSFEFRLTENRAEMKVDEDKIIKCYHKQSGTNATISTGHLATTLWLGS